MNAATFEQAELAKQKAFELLRDLPGLSGIGITAVGQGYGVKVNLRNADAHAAIPEEIDGVRVVAEVIGVITAD
ncbi:MAG TPA: hypothetical protein VF824_17460 [Thermoanaerobaculia bacterium]|jgi:hypothetical protein